MISALFWLAALACISQAASQKYMIHQHLHVLHPSVSFDELLKKDPGSYDDVFSHFYDSLTENKHFHSLFSISESTKSPDLILEKSTLCSGSRGVSELWRLSAPSDYADAIIAERIKHSFSVSFDDNQTASDISFSPFDTPEVQSFKLGLIDKIHFSDHKIAPGAQFVEKRQHLGTCHTQYTPVNGSDVLHRHRFYPQQKLLGALMKDDEKGLLETPVERDSFDTLSFQDNELVSLYSNEFIIIHLNELLAANITEQANIQQKGEAHPSILLSVTTARRIESGRGSSTLDLPDCQNLDSSELNLLELSAEVNVVRKGGISAHTSNHLTAGGPLDFQQVQAKLVSASSSILSAYGSLNLLVDHCAALTPRFSEVPLATSHIDPAVGSRLFELVVTFATRIQGKLDYLNYPSVAELVSTNAILSILSKDDPKGLIVNTTFAADHLKSFLNLTAEDMPPIDPAVVTSILAVATEHKEAATANIANIKSATDAMTSAATALDSAWKTAVSKLQTVTTDALELSLASMVEALKGLQVSDSLTTLCDKVNAASEIYSAFNAKCQQILVNLKSDSFDVIVASYTRGSPGPKKIGTEFKAEAICRKTPEGVSASFSSFMRLYAFRAFEIFNLQYKASALTGQTESRADWQLDTAFGQSKMSGSQQLVQLALQLERQRGTVLRSAAELIVEPMNDFLFESFLGKSRAHGQGLFLWALPDNSTLTSLQTAITAAKFKPPTVTAQTPVPKTEVPPGLPGVNRAPALPLPGLPGVNRVPTLPLPGFVNTADLHSTETHDQGKESSVERHEMLVETSAQVHHHRHRRGKAALHQKSLHSHPFSAVLRAKIRLIGHFKNKTADVPAEAKLPATKGEMEITGLGGLQHFMVYACKLMLNSTVELVKTHAPPFCFSLLSLLQKSSSIPAEDAVMPVVDKTLLCESDVIPHIDAFVQTINDDVTRQTQAFKHILVSFHDIVGTMCMPKFRMISTVPSQRGVDKISLFMSVIYEQFIILRTSLVEDVEMNAHEGQIGRIRSKLGTMSALLGTFYMIISQLNTFMSHLPVEEFVTSIVQERGKSVVRLFQSLALNVTLDDSVMSKIIASFSPPPETIVGITTLVDNLEKLGQAGDVLSECAQLIRSLSHADLVSSLKSLDKVIQGLSGKSTEEAVQLVIKQIFANLKSVSSLSELISTQFSWFLQSDLMSDLLNEIKAIKTLASGLTSSFVSILFNKHDLGTIENLSELIPAPLRAILRPAESHASTELIPALSFTQHHVMCRPGFQPAENTFFSKHTQKFIKTLAEVKFPLHAMGVPVSIGFSITADIGLDDTQGTCSSRRDATVKDMVFVPTLSLSLSATVGVSVGLDFGPYLNSLGVSFSGAVNLMTFELSTALYLNPTVGQKYVGAMITPAVTSLSGSIQFSISAVVFKTSFNIYKWPTPLRKTLPGVCKESDPTDGNKLCASTTDFPITTRTTTFVTRPKSTGVCVPCSHYVKKKKQATSAVHTFLAWTGTVCSLGIAASSSTMRDGLKGSKTVAEPVISCPFTLERFNILSGFVQSQGPNFNVLSAATIQKIFHAEGIVDLNTVEQVWVCDEKLNLKDDNQDGVEYKGLYVFEFKPTETQNLRAELFVRSENAGAFSHAKFDINDIPIDHEYYDATQTLVKPLVEMWRNYFRLHVKDSPSGLSFVNEGASRRAFLDPTFRPYRPSFQLQSVGSGYAVTPLAFDSIYSATVSGGTEVCVRCLALSRDSYMYCPHILNRRSTMPWSLNVLPMPDKMKSLLGQTDVPVFVCDERITKENKYISRIYVAYSADPVWLSVSCPVTGKDASTSRNVGACTVTKSAPLQGWSNFTDYEYIAAVEKMAKLQLQSDRQIESELSVQLPLPTLDDIRDPISGSNVDIKTHPDFLFLGGGFKDSPWWTNRMCSFCTLNADAQGVTCQAVDNSDNPETRVAAFQSFFEPASAGWFQSFARSALKELPWEKSQAQQFAAHLDSVAFMAVTNQFDTVRPSWDTAAEKFTSRTPGVSLAVCDEKIIQLDVAEGETTGTDSGSMEYAMYRFAATYFLRSAEGFLHQLEWSIPLGNVIKRKVDLVYLRHADPESGDSEPGGLSYFYSKIASYRDLHVSFNPSSSDNLFEQF